MNRQWAFFEVIRKSWAVFGSSYQEYMRTNIDLSTSSPSLLLLIYARVMIRACKTSVRHG